MPIRQGRATDRRARERLEARLGVQLSAPCLVLQPPALLTPSASRATLREGCSVTSLMSSASVPFLLPSPSLLLGPHAEAMRQRRENDASLITKARLTIGGGALVVVREAAEAEASKERRRRARINKSIEEGKEYIRQKAAAKRQDEELVAFHDVRENVAAEYDSRDARWRFSSISPLLESVEDGDLILLRGSYLVALATGVEHPAAPPPGTGPLPTRAHLEGLPEAVRKQAVWSVSELRDFQTSLLETCSMPEAEKRVLSLMHVIAHVGTPAEWGDAAPTSSRKVPASATATDETAVEEGISPAADPAAQHDAENRALLELVGAAIAARLDPQGVDASGASTTPYGQIYLPVGMDDPALADICIFWPSCCLHVPFHAPPPRPTPRGWHERQRELFEAGRAHIGLWLGHQRVTKWALPSPLPSGIPSLPADGDQDTPGGGMPVVPATEGWRFFERAVSGLLTHTDERLDLSGKMSSDEDNDMEMPGDDSFDPTVSDECPPSRSRSRPQTPGSRPRTPFSRPQTPGSRPQTPASRPRTPGMTSVASAASLATLESLARPASVAAAARLAARLANRDLAVREVDTAQANYTWLRSLREDQFTSKIRHRKAAVYADAMERRQTRRRTTARGSYQHEWQRLCPGPYEPPRTPNAFVRRLREMAFTSESDAEVCAQQYKEVFVATAPWVEALRVSSGPLTRRWGAREILELIEALPTYARLEDLDMSGHRCVGQARIVRTLCEVLVSRAPPLHRARWREKLPLPIAAFEAPEDINTKPLVASGDSASAAPSPAEIGRGVRSVRRLSLRQCEIDNSGGLALAETLDTYCIWRTRLPDRDLSAPPTMKELRVDLTGNPLGFASGERLLAVARRWGFELVGIDEKRLAELRPVEAKASVKLGEVRYSASTLEGDTGSEVGGEEMGDADAPDGAPSPPAVATRALAEDLDATFSTMSMTSEARSDMYGGDDERE